MRNLSLAEEYKRIRRDFFPRWDRQQQWKCRSMPDLHGAHGRCQREKKTIYVQQGMTGIRLRVVLIHEIAHAVLGPHQGHGRRFGGRILKAAEKAERLGDSELGAALRQEARA